jgi:hypothetical protein
VGEARNYYLKRPYLVASGIDYSILKKYLKQSESAEEFLDALRNDKIDYIILNLGEFNRLQREYHRLDENQWRKMALYLRHLQSKMVFQQKGIFVFKVTRAQPGQAGTKKGKWQDFTIRQPVIKNEER